jgi:membrane-associated protease RseP (regulator of RpoE activity)
MIVPFKLSNTIPLVSAEVDGFAGGFMIDSGFPGSIYLNHSFVVKHDLLNKFNSKFEAITGWGIGGPVRTGVIRAQAFKLGEETMRDLVVTLSLVTKGSSADPYLAGAIGAELLRRFTVTFDYGRRRMHLERNAHYEEKEIFDRSGMYLVKQAQWFEVIEVIKGGPAAEAGIKPGDRIVSIDGKKATALTMPEVRSKLRGPVNTRITLIIKRDDSTDRKVLVLKDLI